MSLRKVCQVLSKTANAVAATSLKRSAAVTHQCQRCLSNVVDPPDFTPPIPLYVDRGKAEKVETKRARLVYQSRKRGITESCLLLSTFAARHLDTMTDEELVMYDTLINKPTNDWELYYWMTGNKPTPEEYDNSVMDKLKKHTQNEDREVRLVMPGLPEDDK